MIITAKTSHSSANCQNSVHSVHIPQSNPKKLTTSSTAQKSISAICSTQKMSSASALGKDTKSQSTKRIQKEKSPRNAQENRRSAYALKRTSAKLLPASRVGHCLNTRVSAEKGVDIRLNKANGKANYGNLMRCDSVWLCPCCSARILAKRGSEVEEGVKNWNEAGGSMWMITLTHSHSKEENLAKKMKLLQKALSRFFGDRAMKSAFNQINKIGQIKALETTYSEKNGWHPHHHILMFSSLTPEKFQEETIPVTFDKNGYVQYVSPEREEMLINKGRIDDIKQVTFEFFIKNYWIKICKAVGLGLPSFENGVKIGDASSVKTYLTKYKTAHELTNAQSKRAKNGNRNQWEILADAHAGDFKSGKLWQIYADAFQGQRQLFWSRGLKELLMIEEVEDDEISELDDVTSDDEVISIYELQVSLWNYIVKRGWQADVLDVVEDDFADGTVNFPFFIEEIKKLQQHELEEKIRKERERQEQEYLSWLERPPSSNCNYH